MLQIPEVDYSKHCWLRNAARTALALACLVLPPALPGTAAAAQKEPALPGQRYLLVVETSHSMRRRMKNTLPIIRELLSSGFHGEVRAGDSLGVWTYNDELHTGRLPAQDLSPSLRGEVATRTVEFLKAQKCENQARIEKVYPALRGVVGGSQLITVILVTCGEEELQFSRFDPAINPTYSLWREQQAKKRMPFVTILRGYSARIQGATVAAAPFPLEFPPLPEASLFAKKVEAPAAQPKTRTAPLTYGPPLIVSGSKPKTSPPTVITTMTATNAPPHTPAAPDLSLAASNPPVALPLSETVPPPATNPAPAPSPEPKPQPAAAAQPAAAPPTPTNSDKQAIEPAVAKPTPPGGTRASSGGGAAPIATPVAGAATGSAHWGGARLPALGGGCLLILCLAGLWWWRRSRPREHLSLITESLDREQR